MTVDVESNKRQLLVKNVKKMASWKSISQIIENDNDKDLKVQLERGASAESVVRPQDAEHNRTALHEAVDKGATKCLNLLLNSNLSKELLDSPDDDGQSPLYVAVKNLNSVAVEKLLAAGVNPNSRNDQGHTALHYLAYSASSAMTSDKLAGVMKCTDLLLANPNIHLEALNKSHFTPLRAAAEKFPCKASSLEEFCRKLVNSGSYADQKTKEKLDQHCIPKISFPTQGQRDQKASIAEIFNIFILNKPEEIPVRLNNHRPQDLREAVNGYMGSKKMLYYLVDKSNEEGVKCLLKLGADPWSYNINGELSLHRALARAHYPIVNCLIEKMKKSSKNIDLQKHSFTLLQKSLESQEKNSRLSADVDPMKCLRRLFVNDIMLDVNQKQEGSLNQTSLHIAGALNNQKAMAILLENGAYLGERRVIGSHDVGTVLNALMGKTLYKAMDNCITTSTGTSEQTEDDLLDPDYTLDMSYQFLMPPKSEGTSKVPEVHNEVAVLFDISQSKEHRNAIKHPLIQTLLYAKWRKVFPLYVLNLILYFTFVLLLTTFMYTLKNLRILERMEASGNYTDYTVLQNDIHECQLKRVGLMVFVLIITLYMAVKEIFQIKFTYISYFRHIENYLEWFLIVAVAVACVVPLSVDATRHLAAWAMIAAWYEFVLVLGRAPPLAIYITMLRHVSWNFLKVVFLFGFLIIAFSISFNIILQPSVGQRSDGDFSAFWTTLPRAIVMSTGEFEYSEISSELSSNPIFATSTVLIFLVFLFLIFLVLMNVMTGLAVTDAKEIVEDAILYSLKSRLELVYLNEQLFLKLPFLHKLLPRLQVLDNKHRRLRVKINKLPKSQRVLLGEDGYGTKCKLDNRTAEVLRNHRLHQMAEARAEREGTPITQILALLQEIRGQVMAPGNP
uniref:Transient receptor potential cation channel protein painless-like n=2 Tax=Hirondellea gigas TaxID=1518452 RepID=A0A2P2I232_9CRUS